jgi:hypothetical protein
MSELSALNSLLKASSKVAVEKCIGVTFTSRLENSKVLPLFSRLKSYLIEAEVVLCCRIALSLFKVFWIWKLWMKRKRLVLELFGCFDQFHRETYGLPTAKKSLVEVHTSTSRQRRN